MTDAPDASHQAESVSTPSGRERLLWTIAQGTAGSIGDEFFALLVRHAAVALGARYALLAETIDEHEAMALAYWQDAAAGDRFRHRLAESPFETVARGAVFNHSSGVGAAYPSDPWLRQIAADSCVSVPMKLADGSTVGYFAVVHSAPMVFADDEVAVLQLFADRAATELVRRRAFESLERMHHESEARFQDLFDEAPIAYVHEGVDSRFIRANRAAMRILGITADQVEGTYGKDFVPDTPDAQRRLQEALAAMGSGTDTSGVLLELRRRDTGAPLWIQWWSKPDASGRFSRTMFIDVTERVLLAQDQARLEAQNSYLRDEIRAEHNFGEIVGSSPALLQVLRQVEQIARVDSTVLILGETGTGKELVARAIHDASSRRHRSLVKVNCGAISAGLVESELFGHVKGAFTGAIANRDGRFKVADGGTIFLDEVGELPPDVQVKLLRVLQEQEFEPIGSNRTIKVNVRVVAATNRDLEALVREGKFRADLFYRLNVLPIRMPSLRERMTDLPLLVAFFVQRSAKGIGKRIASVSPETMRRLTTYSWPGNIRELQNVIERAVILSPGDTLELAENLRVSTPPATVTPPESTAPAGDGTPAAKVPAAPPTGSLQDAERRHIEAVLDQVKWVIEGETGAAKVLRMNPSTLRSRMQKLGIARRR